MHFEMEELLPIVGRLVERYTGMDSTSVSYEKAEQLMEAVLYCIRETELETPWAVADIQGTSARQIYEAGKGAVEKKVKKALKLYHELLPEFSSYGNPYLSETILKGMPEFFRRYDVEFNPQDTILTLDYPVLKDLSGYTGIDRIYEFLVCLDLEQHFLKAFPEDFVNRVLRSRYGEGVEMVDNLCETLLSSMAGALLLQKPLEQERLSQEDALLLRHYLAEMELSEIKNQLGEVWKSFVQLYCENSGEVFEYLKVAIDGIAARLKNMV